METIFCESERALTSISMHGAAKLLLLTSLDFLLCTTVVS